VTPAQLVAIERLTALARAADELASAIRDAQRTEVSELYRLLLAYQERLRPAGDAAVDFAREWFAALSAIERFQR
jgi:hypothetical protein